MLRTIIATCTLSAVGSSSARAGKSQGSALPWTGRIVCIACQTQRLRAWGQGRGWSRGCRWMPNRERRLPALALPRRSPEDLSVFCMQILCMPVECLIQSRSTLGVIYAQWICSCVKASRTSASALAGGSWTEAWQSGGLIKSSLFLCMCIYVYGLIDACISGTDAYIHIFIYIDMYMYAYIYMHTHGVPGSQRLRPWAEEGQHAFDGSRWLSRSFSYWHPRLE